MAVAAILAGGVFDLLRQLAGHGNSKNSCQQIKQEFQHLGSDLQAGNLSQAQSDFATLQQNLPGSSRATSGSSQSSSQSSAQTLPGTLTAAVNQLAQDLQSGNLSAAQSDLASVQQDVQQIGTQQGAGSAHHHHHHHSSNSDSTLSSSQQQTVSSLFSELGQSLQSGNLTAAQQVYTSLQQDFQQFLQSSSSSTATLPQTGGSSVNVSV